MGYTNKLNQTETDEVFQEKIGSEKARAEEVSNEIGRLSSH